MGSEMCIRDRGMPPYILNNSYMPPMEFQVTKRFVVDDYNKLELRKTHQEYGPVDADVGMLYDLFPSFIQVITELESDKLGVSRVLNKLNKPMASCR